ncbi:MAG: replicative DNA helicase [Christensenellaceae bacterium]
MAENAVQNRIPPNHFEAEQAILGSMLLSEKCVYDAMETMQEIDFYHQQHRDIFRVMGDLMTAGISVDLVTVSQKMEQEGKMRMGGMEYLAQLTSIVPSVANLKHYMNIVKQKSALRNLIELCMEIVDDCYKGENDAREIANKAASAVLKIALKDNRNSMVHLREALQQSYLKISEAMKAKDGLMGLPTGFPYMDGMLSGLQGGQLVVIAGRPGMGKTSFAMNIVQHIGLTQKAVCLIFSLEMAADQLGARMLCSEAKVDSQITRSGKVGGAEITKLAEAMKVLSGTQIYIDDSATINATEMLAKAQSLKKREGLNLIAIDYLQLLQGTGRIENRQQEVAQITRTLKIMAKELDVPILLLSQLSRASEKREKKSRYPMLSDLRESGAIEQDADVVIFLHREDYYAEDKTPENEGKARIIIAKQRNGPTGAIAMQWQGEYTKYIELDYVHDDEEAPEY